MGRMGVDVESGGPLPDNTYRMTLGKVLFQVKRVPTDSWNAENTLDVDAASFSDYERQVPDPDTGKMKAISRIRLMMKVDAGEEKEGRTVWDDLYMGDSSVSIINSRFKGLGVSFGSDFDPEDVEAAVGTLCVCKVALEERKDKSGTPTGEFDNRIKSIKVA